MVGVFVPTIPASYLVFIAIWLLIIAYSGLGLSVGGIFWLSSFSFSGKKWLKNLLCGWFFSSWIGGAWSAWVYFKYFYK